MTLDDDVLIRLIHDEWIDPLTNISAYKKEINNLLGVVEDFSPNEIFYEKVILPFEYIENRKFFELWVDSDYLNSKFSFSLEYFNPGFRARKIYTNTNPFYTLEEIFKIFNHARNVGIIFEPIDFEDNTTMAVKTKDLKYTLLEKVNMLIQL